MENQNEKAQPQDESKYPQPGITHNLDTGKDEPLKLPSEEDDVIMDFGSGSGGGSAGDGGAA